jgi:hypothetical protein
MQYAFTKLFVLGLMALMLGCSDDGDGVGPGKTDGNFYVRFKLDGVEKEYKTLSQVVFHYAEDTQTYHAELVGGLTIASDANTIVFFLYNDEPYATGVEYDLKTPVQVGPATMPQVVGVILDENGESYTAQFLPADWFDFQDDADLKFTLLNDKVAEGTFSARVFSSMPERTERKITDGEFRLSVVDLK